MKFHTHLIKNIAKHVGSFFRKRQILLGSKHIRGRLQSHAYCTYFHDYFFTKRCIIRRNCMYHLYLYVCILYHQYYDMIHICRNTYSYMRKTSMIGEIGQCAKRVVSWVETEDIDSYFYKFVILQKSNDTTYHKLWEVMKAAKPTVFTEDNLRGKDRVLSSKGNYAFFMESTQIEFYNNRYCVLKMVGSQLDSKEYGVAFPKSMETSFENNIIIYFLIWSVLQ